MTANPPRDLDAGRSDTQILQIAAQQGDLGAAMTLCHTISFFITSTGGTRLYPDHPAVWVGGGEPVMAASDAPEDIARAICEAWLVYTERTAAAREGE